MAANNITVNTESIDYVLRDANICLHELNHFDHILKNGPVVDVGKIEARVPLLFRNMMSSLYSVLDQVYYFLYCHYQNNGEASFAAQAFQINAPCKQNLKWSEDPTRDAQPECSPGRTKWLDDRCREIFGSPAPEQSVQFVKNLLSLQAVRKVNSAGQPVTNNAGDISLVHFSNGGFDPLLSTGLEDWKDVTSFNLLHFYRNFTTHRTLLQAVLGTGYLNSITMKFAPEHILSAEQINNKEWYPVGKGLFIIVPELSHLRDTTRVGAPTFHWKPLANVCSRLFSCVERQRQNLVKMAVQNHDYPYKVGWTSNYITVDKENVNKGNDKWSKRWSVWDSTRLDMG